MRPAKVVVTNRIHEDVAALLRRTFHVVTNAGCEPFAPDALLAHARDADAMLAFMSDAVDARFLEACPKLRVIACALKGFDNFDIAACTRRGVLVTYVDDLLTAPTAELAIGLMIALARNILPGDAHVRSGAFRGWRPHLFGGSIDGATVGILGMGAVGKAIAHRLAGFRCRILYDDANRVLPEHEDVLRATRRARAELLSESDFVVTVMPLTAETRHVIDAAALARMKPGAYLINPGRGSLVDESAVADALEAGHLAGYAADVFEMEDWARPDRPAVVHPRLLALRDKTVLTPHLGSAVARVRREIEREAAQSIIDFFAHGAARKAVNPEVLDQLARRR